MKEESRECELRPRQIQNTEHYKDVCSISSKESPSRAAPQPSYLVVILAGHHIGEGDLSLEHFPAVHELHQQVADGLELHPLGWLDIRENQAWKYLSKHIGENTVNKADLDPQAGSVALRVTGPPSY